MTWLGGAWIGLSAFGVLTLALGADPAASPEISTNTVAAAEKLAGLEFTAPEREMMLQRLRSLARDYQRLRQVPLPNHIPPALVFNPAPAGFHLPTGEDRLVIAPRLNVALPEPREELAFYSIPQLAALIRSGAISSVELTQFFLGRLRQFGPKLECVVTLMADSALEEARAADAELAAGKDRGLLHGIPYGAKDLLAAKGAPTTWGAATHTNQVIPFDATVVAKLREAGAVLVAKLTLGELAMGDVWFGGKTRSPWDHSKGSSGSSAGSSAATSAGLVPYAIGSETWGSIVSPAARCGITGLRPTFGSVSRFGAMTLSWSMDKIGPLARSAEDCAIVFQAIHGADPLDPSTVAAPFRHQPRRDLAGLRIGWLKRELERDSSQAKLLEPTLRLVRELGAELVPMELPTLPIGALSLILDVEASAAFEEFSRLNLDDGLVQQHAYSWPNQFRSSRLVTAVEYIQANRVRTLLIQQVAEKLKDFDLYIAPSGSDNLLMNNLTGHPCVAFPNGMAGDTQPASLMLVGRLHDEGRLLSVAQLLQRKGGWLEFRPPGYSGLAEP